MSDIDKRELPKIDAQPRSERSEEVHHIIERMPTKFGLRVSMLVGGMVLLLIVFGWVVNYPDIVTGEVTINAQQGPIKLVASISGKIKLLTKSQQWMAGGSYIGYLQNAADVEDVELLKRKLAVFSPIRYFDHPDSTFSSDLTLGEITAKYFNFLSATEDAYSYKHDNLYIKQKAGLLHLLNQQNQTLIATQQQLIYNQNSVELNSKFFRRDSILLKKNFEAEADFDKAKINYLNVLQAYNNTKEDLIVIREKIDDTKNQLEQLDVKIRQKELQLKLNLNASYSDLLDNIKLWEQKYVFVAPISGKVQFLKFWNDGQFVQPGEEVFTVVPEQNKIIGQCILPASGAGKVKVGQEAVIKLENYPYREFGYIKGKVSEISLTTNLAKTKDQAVINNYLVLIDLSDKLKTNYGTQLDFKFELKGVAEIITHERKLGSRLFDNLKEINERN